MKRLPENSKGLYITTSFQRRDKPIFLLLKAICGPEERQLFFEYDRMYLEMIMVLSGLFLIHIFKLHCWLGACKEAFHCIRCM